MEWIEAPVANILAIHDEVESVGENEMLFGAHNPSGEWGFRASKYGVVVWKMNDQGIYPLTDFHLVHKRKCYSRYINKKFKWDELRDAILQFVQDVADGKVVNS